MAGRPRPRESSRLREDASAEPTLNAKHEEISPLFTGIVEELGQVIKVLDAPPGKRIVIQAQRTSADAKLGDSVCVNGCCLTVVDLASHELGFDAGPETLARTNLGHFAAGDGVNLERSLAVGDRLGGHFVTGHIDDMGQIDERIDENDWSTFWFRCPTTLTRQMVPKGSVAIDGISLTIVHVETERFSVALIPHTLKVTTLGRKQPGDTVNLETDLLAKYVQKQLDPSHSG